MNVARKTKVDSILWGGSWVLSHSITIVVNHDLYQKLSGETDSRIGIHRLRGSKTAPLWMEMPTGIAHD
jgi:hypothetical protein